MSQFRKNADGENVAWAIWRRLDTPGHDAARLVRAGAGYLLAGTAVFLHAKGKGMQRFAYYFTLDL